MRGWLNMAKMFDGKKVYDRESFSYELAKFGDYVTEEVVDVAINCLPPTTLRGDLVQDGEPYSYQYDPEADRWRATYTTFAKVDGEWTYCGKCFVGKTKEPKGLPKA